MKAVKVDSTSLRLLPPCSPRYALVLMMASFFLGHLSQRFYDRGPKSHEVLNSQSTGLAQPRRALRVQFEDETNDIEPEVPLPPNNPLNTPELEKYMLEGSSLPQVRPPIPAGLSGENFLRVIPFQILSWAPRLVVFPAFLDPKRCQTIINLAKPQLRKSELAWKPGEKEDASQQTRTSSGVFLSPQSDPTGTLAWVEERIAAATRIPVANGEPFNILKYQLNQHYESHLDAFDPKEYGPQTSQRIATVLVYLSDVEEGGETIFKREGFGNLTAPIKDWRTCDDGQGYKYKPRAGDAVLFYDGHPSLDLDEHALHGGCPVKQGEKWVMTKWLRNTKMNVDTAAQRETRQIDEINSKLLQDRHHTSAE